MTPPLTHLLDTSGLLAHYRGEPGVEEVDALLSDSAQRVGVSSLTWLEFRVRLAELTPDSSEQSEAMAIYSTLLGEGVPVTDSIADLA
jgi:predicted nucleic acid-binding protein